MKLSDFSLRRSFIINNWAGSQAIIERGEAILAALRGDPNADELKRQANEHQTTLAAEFKSVVFDIALRHNAKILVFDSKKIELQIDKAGGDELRKLDPAKFLVAPPFRNVFVNT